MRSNPLRSNPPPAVTVAGALTDDEFATAKARLLGS